MSRHTFCVGLLLTAVSFVGLVSRPAADEPKKAADKSKKAAELSTSDLALEVAALRTLYYLKATPAQLDALGRLAKETMSQPRDRKGKAGAEYRRVLAELREALAEQDDERIDTLDDQLDELSRSEAPDLDEEVTITSAARKHAPQLLRKLKATQVASFLGLYADTIADPEDQLVDIVDKVRDLKPAEWKEKRDSFADEIAGLVAGVEEGKTSKLREEIISLLDRIRGMKAEEFESRRAELEQTARQLTANAGPTEVLRNVMERTLASLLSNPRLTEALKARSMSGF
jgi:hypothetical protein